MKASREFFEEVKSEIEKLPIQDLVNDYENGEFVRSDKVKDLNIRFRWDLFWMIAPKLSETAQIEMGYLHDDHLDTVLKKLVPKIVRKY